MSVPLLPWPRAKFFAPNTNYPLAGGKVYTYAAGTTTPLGTYSDPAGTIPNTNPVILDANGEAAIYLTNALSYKINITDASDVQVPGYPVDQLIGTDNQLRSDLANTSNVSLGDALVGVKQPLTGAVGRTQHSKNYDIISVKDFGAMGNGIADDTVAIQAAINSLPSSGGLILFPFGTYVISSTITLGNGTPTTISTLNNIRLKGTSQGASPADSTQNGAATRIVWNGSSGGTMVQINGPVSACGLEDIELDCNNLAASGLIVLHSFSSTYRNILIGGYTTGPAFQMKSRDNAISGMIRGCDDNIVDSVKVINPQSANSNAVDLGTSSPASSSVVGCSRNTFVNCFWVGGTTGNALRLRFIDNSVFLGVTAQTIASPVTSGNSLDIAPPATAQTFPNEISFVNSPLLGTKTITGTWTDLSNLAFGVTFLPYVHADDFVNQPTHANIYGLMRTHTRVRQGACRAGLSGTQSIPNNTETAVNWNTENFDTDFFHNNGVNPSRITATIKGCYSFKAGVQFFGNATGTRYAFFKVNGTDSYAIAQMDGSANGNWLVMSDDIYLNAGDYVEVICYQNSGGALNVGSSGGSHLSAFFVGV